MLTRVAKRKAEKEILSSGSDIGGDAKRARTDQTTRLRQARRTIDLEHTLGSLSSIDNTRPQRSRYVGHEYLVGETRFINKRDLYVSEFQDYTLLSNQDFTPFIKHATQSLKESLVPRWRYAMHISHGMTPSITRHLLHSRVIGGQILAYKYLSCSVEGNESVYYGFVPTTDEKLEGLHKECRFSMLSVYPRKLYVYLEKVSACTCSTGCMRWSSLLNDSKSRMSFCGKSIPWERLHVMMGDLDEEFREVLKESRDCVVCAQCFDCSKSAAYCRKHRVCKHRHAVEFTGDLCSLEFPLDSATMKTCSRVLNMK